MSSRFKRCKTCGTTNSSDFAPRKSVICKACESGPSISVLPFVPETSEKVTSEMFVETLNNINSEPQVQEQVQSESRVEVSKESSEIKKETLNDSETSEIKADEASNFISRDEYNLILHKFAEVEANYNLLKVEVDKLGRLKKMFPRMFPEDNPI